MPLRLSTCPRVALRVFASIQFESTKQETQSAKVWPSATPLDGPDTSSTLVMSFLAMVLIVTNQFLKKIIFATNVIAIMEELVKDVWPMRKDATATMQGLGMDVLTTVVGIRNAIVSSSAFRLTTAMMGHASFELEPRAN